jgi:hypothetical protein
MPTERWYEEGDAPQEDWERFALFFVQELCNENFEAAYDLLSASFRSSYSLAELRSDYRSISSAKSTPIGPAWVLSSIEWWPDKAVSDFGMSYVQIGGDFNEAIAPRVSQAGGALVVSAIEWGRP